MARDNWPKHFSNLDSLNRSRGMTLPYDIAQCSPCVKVRVVVRKSVDGVLQLSANPIPSRRAHHVLRAVHRESERDTQRAQFLPRGLQELGFVMTLRGE